ncbi:MAG: hypothetical protein NZ108_08640, partial [Bacteroidia bacterium]|nr:hypothetical protein [Bacteroidia bacterium]
EVELWTIDGRKIQSYTFKEVEAGTRRVTINGNELSTGLYLVKAKVSNSNGTSEKSKKLFISR